MIQMFLDQSLLATEMPFDYNHYSDQTSLFCCPSSCHFIHA